jgi:hypothetical protein
MKVSLLGLLGNCLFTQQLKRDLGAFPYPASNPEDRDASN